jgi:hypothetical protein
MDNILEKLRAAVPQERKSPDLPTRSADARVGSSSTAPTIENQKPKIDNSLTHSAAFSPQRQLIHDHGLISILKQLHDQLDAFDPTEGPPPSPTTNSSRPRNAPT